MTEVPKIVYDRLRSASPGHDVPERTHPDADLLAAFAEQALSAAERDAVLGHLSFCAHCREVIALALPSLDPVTAPFAVKADPLIPVRVKAPSWLASRNLAWPSLRWAALATGIVVAASVFLVHPGRLKEANRHSENPQFAPASPLTPAPTIPPSLATTGSADQLVSTDQLIVAENKQALRKSLGRLSRQANAGQVAEKKNSKETDALWSSAQGVSDHALKTQTRETTELAAAPPAMDAQSATSLMAMNEAPAIEKAKPAPQEVQSDDQPADAKSEAAKLQARNVTSAAKSAAGPPLLQKVNATWTITMGALQRSVDSGQSWQTVLQAEHSLLCYASHNEDIWAGGQAGAIFHSTDGGVTWRLLRPSMKGDVLSADITRIELDSDMHRPAEVVLSTGNSGNWSSSDGGETWNRK